MPRSGKGGAVGNFELLPFNEPHPLSLALLDSSPIGEPRASLPPLGVVLRAANQNSNDCRWQSYLCFVPRSGKGGVVGNFELLPFNEPHPLSLALLDSSPIGEPRASLPPLGEVPRSGKGGDVGWLRVVHFPIQPTAPPLRLAKSRLTAVARLHGACASLSQPLRAASSPIGEPSLTSPERGGGPRVSVAEGFAVRRIPFEMRQGESVQATWLPRWGSCRAKRD